MRIGQRLPSWVGLQVLEELGELSVQHAELKDICAASGSVLYWDCGKSFHASSHSTCCISFASEFDRLPSDTMPLISPVRLVFLLEHLTHG